MTNESWRRELPDGRLMLAVHVQPGAKKTEIVGVHGDALKIRLAAPAVDGKANTALIQFLAELLAVPRRNVELVRGTTSRDKLLRIAGVKSRDLGQLQGGS